MLSIPVYLNNGFIDSQIEKYLAAYHHMATRISHPSTSPSSFSLTVGDKLLVGQN
jgi:hypothetical protein